MTGSRMLIPFFVTGDSQKQRSLSSGMKARPRALIG
jgi:hypothetical protein